MASKQCAICGENSGMYPLCKKHLEMKEQGLVTKDELTGKWKESKNKETKQNNISKQKCITCGKETEGYLFCPECYYKYKEKEILIKITKCTNIELLDESYEGLYHCKDGHIVKSKSERDIDNYLFEHKIPHAYEKKLIYGEKENEYLLPDFFLPNYLGEGKHIFVEHWGYNENNIKYTMTKKFKTEIYKKLKETLVYTYEKKDAKDIESALERKLNKNNIKENEINFNE